MIAVATGGPRIGDVEGAFARDYDKAAIELGEEAYPKPSSVSRLVGDRHCCWSSGDMPS